MNEIAYNRLTELASMPDSVERATVYLSEKLGQFLKRRDKVLICFPDAPATIGGMMKEAVIRCGAVPLFLQGDHRWLTMLKTAFVTKCDAMIGAPLMMLGLAKVAKHMGTPLFARNVLIAGYPSPDWMIDGIQRGLDCRVWGCYDPGISAMIAGFSCPHSRGIHLRSDRYWVKILDEKNNPVPNGEIGRVILSPRCEEIIDFDTGDKGRLETGLCGCGSAEPRLMDIDTHLGIDPVLSRLGESFHYWGSILDCKVANTGCGLEIELVVFPGEKLPKMPECAKLVVRAWQPESDEPFPHAYVLKKRIFSQDNH